MDANPLLVIFLLQYSSLALVPTSFGVAFDVWLLQTSVAIVSRGHAFRTGLDAAGSRLCMTSSTGTVTHCAVRYGFMWRSSKGRNVHVGALC